ncbi:hypothetical protein IKB17_06505 [bacterium]|nr:hypothetical protein [bacterium]
MKAIERLGITKEKFHAVFEEKKGFNSEFNKNHPSYDSGESCLSFMKSGADKLISENGSVVLDIITNIG